MQDNTTSVGTSDYIDRIKSIPILDICAALGIDVLRRGQKYWCKLRANERTASTVLNVHKLPNTYVDFGGTNKESDVIQFVAEAMNTDRSNAVKYLADAFNIKREAQNVFSSDLAIWEWDKLNIRGDLATKNFSFDIERQGIAKVAELSQKYGMPMNELRKKHPKMYEQLLYDHALPHVRSLRNEYYIGLIHLHNMLKIEDFSKYPDLRESIMKEIKELQNAEWLLKKACVRTSIKAYPAGEYDPEEDLKKLVAGEIRPAVGNRSYSQLHAAANMKNCGVKYRTVPWEKFSYRALELFSHSAFIKGDNVVIGYLECDHADIKPRLDAMCGKDSLGQKIAGAESKLQNATPGSTKQAQHQTER